MYIPTMEELLMMIQNLQKRVAELEKLTAQLRPE
jgi:hypothetical protein